jgi:DNA-binding protein YbaB
MKNERIEEAERRVRELLEEHAKKTEAGGTHEVGGIVSLTVNSHLQLTAVRLLDTSIDASKRHAVEQAIIEAVNGAMQKVVKSSAESLSQLQSSDDWKSAVGEVFRGGTAR